MYIWIYKNFKIIIAVLIFQNWEQMRLRSF